MLAIGFFVGFVSSFLGFSGVAYVYKPITQEVVHSPVPIDTPVAISTPIHTQTALPRPVDIDVASPTLEPTLKPTVKPTLKPQPTPSVAPIPTPTSTSTPEAAVVEPTSTPDVWSPPQMDSIFAQFAGQYGVDKNILERIANCESHFNPNAANGDYLGMFQFSTSTWQNYRGQLGMDPNPALRTDVTESIRTAAFMLSKRGTSAWPACSS